MSPYSLHVGIERKTFAYEVDQDSRRHSGQHQPLLPANLQLRPPAVRIALTGSAALCVLTGAAEAGPARCFTSDDGYYEYQFVATDRQGSFSISARGKPTVLLNVDQPSTAFGFADFGTRNVALPGRAAIYAARLTRPAGSTTRPEQGLRMVVRNGR